MELFEQEFAGTLHSEAIPDLADSGGEVIDYLGAFTALVELPSSDATMLAESTIPLRAPEQGQLQPLDGELVRQGDHFEVDNAPVEAEIAVDVEDGVTFDAQDVTVDLAQSSGPAREAADKVFYPNVAQDTDLLVSPLPAGVEVIYQLRSQSSPEEFELGIDADAAEIRIGDAGEALVTGEGGQKLLSIAAPIAWDTEGRSVDVSYATEGASIILEVNHQDEDLLYPIVVDPPVESYWNLAYNEPIFDGPYWTNTFTAGFTWSRQIDGLQQTALNNKTFPTWSRSQFEFRSIRDDYIGHARFYNFDRFSGNPATCTTVGIYNPEPPTSTIYSDGIDWWEPGTIQNESGTSVGWAGYAVQNICDAANQSVAHNSRYAWVGPAYYPEYAHEPPGTRGNMAVFALNTPNPGYRWAQSSNRLRSATIYRYDRNTPSVAVTPKPQWGEWVDDGGAAHQVQLAGNDPGLGMNLLEVRDRTGGANQLLVQKDHPCTGRREAPCQVAMSETLGYQLQEGRRQLEGTAHDIIQHISAPGSWEQRIDRTGPVFTDISGPLEDDAWNLLTTLDYELTVTATDGDSNQAALNRSGVTKIELLVGGQVISYYDGEQEEQVTLSKEQPCTAPEGSCPMTAEFLVPGDLLQLGAGQLQVRATDALGHTTTSAVTTAVRDDDAEPAVDLQAGVPDAQGDFHLDISIDEGSAYNEPGAFGSGFSRYELFSDGELIEEFDRAQPCAAGGCDHQETMSLSSTRSPDDHELTLVAYDRAGNASTKTLGKRKSRFARYGFNDNISDEILQKEADAGANSVRFPVDWCRVVGSEPEGSHPSSWDWDGDGNPATNPGEPAANPTGGSLDAVMGAIAAHNADEPPNRELDAVAQLTDAPAWASNDDNSDGDTDGCPTAPLDDPPDPANYASAPPAPPDSAHVNEWQEFVQAFLSRYAYISDNRLVAIEAWNEPNLPKFWGSFGVKTKNWTQHDPAHFAALVNATADAIDALGLKDQIILLPGGLSPEGKNVKNFSESYLPALTDKSSIDALSLHFYASYRRKDKGAAEKIKEDYQLLQSALNATNYENKDRWITEIGFPSGLDSQSGQDNPIRKATPGKQKRRLEHAFVTYAHKMPVKAFFVHRLLDDPIPPDLGGETANFGVFGRPAYCALVGRVGWYQEDLGPRSGC